VSATHRRWTRLGTLATDARALVDTRGLVSATAGWALDWWVGADDRWHLPQHDAAVRQRLVDAMPVVETAMHIPGGDAVQRAYAVRDPGPQGTGRDLLVVEIENRSAVPFALALAVRPFDAYDDETNRPTGRGGPAEGGRIGSIALDGLALVVDGRTGVLLPRAPARAASRTGADGEVEGVVVAGQAPAALAPVTCRDGRASAALIYPLPHTAILRVALPLGDPPPRHRRSRPKGAGAAPDGTDAAVGFPAATPSAGQVAKGWEAQTRRPMTLSVPDPRWTELTDAHRAFLLLGAAEADTWADATVLLGALVRWGFAAEARLRLEALGDQTRSPGPADGAALVALADHWRLTGDRALVAEQSAAIAAAVARADRPSRRARPEAGSGLAWRRRGLRAAAELLDAIDQPDAARAVLERVGRLAPPTADHGHRGEGALAGDAGDLRPARVLERATAGLALPAAADRRQAVAPRLAWVLSVIGPTSVWPEQVDPDQPDRAVGRGHDPVAGAAWLRLVRDVLVREEGADGLDLCSWLPETWRGQGFEVHHAPTAHGSVSYAVRWHGERPALLWEREPGPSARVAPVTLRAPGLDPAWSTREPRGEALLAPAAAAPGSGHDGRGASLR